MPLSDDARARLEADAAQIIGRYPRSRSALLPLLHLVQSEEGFVSEDGLAFSDAVGPWLVSRPVGAAMSGWSAR